MKLFFEKYKLQILFFNVIFLIFWSAFTLYRFSISGEGMHLVGGFAIGVFALIRAFDFYQLYKKVKTGKRRKEIII